MQYRPFGQLNWEGSALGSGMMRLPVLDGDTSRIDKHKASEMVRYAIDQGVNYVDTAYPYHKEQSEPFTGEVLKGGYRDKVRLATKLPSWKIEERADFDRYLNQQLQRLQTDHIDFYLLHALNESFWSNLYELGVLDWAEGAIRDGRIRHLGFSFHDRLELFKKIVDAYDWTFVQIQYNYMDVEYQAGTEGLRYAADRGLAVVVMEPLRGGQLAAVEPPAPIADIWQHADRSTTPADWALQWLWNQPEVSVVLSGMTELLHVRENVASADRSGVGTLSAQELETVGRVRQAYNSLAPIPCTRCKYCLPCPNEVRIPTILGLYNHAKMYKDLDGSRTSYKMLKEKNRADNCVACEKCEEACPQSIAIIDWLEKAHEALSP